MQVLADFSLNFNNESFKPLFIGGMGVDISSEKLALEGAKIGAIGHISDALVHAVCDKYYQTQFSKEKLDKYKYNKHNTNKEKIKFDIDKIKEATKMYVGRVMEKKKGVGKVFVNCMEKLTMNNPLETLKARLESAMSAGIDGITLSAGLHLSSFSLVKDHPRFRSCKLGIIVSSVRALKIFLQKNNKLDRLPDYIVVEGPLAGGHLGFGMDWFRYKLQNIVKEVTAFLKEHCLKIPIIAAGGVFSGSEGVDMINAGASGIQVATRFTITQECGLPERIKKEYLKAKEEDVYVSQVSPTGYPMRILKQSPALNSGILPNCEALGYILNSNSKCAYIEAYKEAIKIDPKRPKVKDKVCICTHMKNFKLWTCGHNVYRLKDTVAQAADGNYILPTASHVLQDYLYSSNYEVHKPQLAKAVQV
jgi:NAD(P)H-dependent flavin oxidoreductase YrpB (nitropropane dioxygenase family)